MKFSKQFIKAGDALCDFDNHVNAPYISNTDDVCYYDNYDITNIFARGVIIQ